jgi:hypothetical protein
LRLDRDDSTAELPPTAHAVAGVRADVEAQRAGLYELRGKMA